jgi:subtilisin
MTVDPERGRVMTTAENPVRSHRRRPVLVIVALAVMCALLSAPRPAQASSGPAKAYIVVLKNSVPNPAAFAASQGHAYGFQATFVYGHALKGFAASLSPSAAQTIAADPRVAFLEPDTPVSAAAQVVPNWTKRVDADDSSAKSGDGTGTVDVNVAVIDSGIDFTHPDLHVVGGTDCTSGKGFGDPNGHGTFVAGIIGALDNDFGVVGVAPGANLYAVRVLNKKAVGSESAVLCGIDWVTATRTDADPTNNIAVANMSLGGKGSDGGDCGNTPKRDAEHQAICASVAAGVTYVAGAGNDSADFQNFRPATYDEVLTATAMDDTDGQPGGLTPPSATGCGTHAGDDVPAFFSNFATLPADQAHTIAAPGVCDLSTYTGGIYAVASGTSAASPVVAGTVALCIASGPCAGLTPAQIVQKIVSDATAYNTANPGYGFTGDPLHNPDPNKYYGYLIRSGSY